MGSTKTAALILAVTITPVSWFTPSDIDWDWLTDVDRLHVLDVLLPEVVTPVGWGPHASQPLPTRRVPHPIPPQEVESLLTQYFAPADMEWALRVSYCESGWDANAKNRSSTASGLFQALKGWWSGAWGYPAFDPFNPQANVEFAAWLYYTGGPQHWECR